MRDRYPIMQGSYYFSFKGTIYSEDENSQIATLMLVITNSVWLLHVQLLNEQLILCLMLLLKPKKIGGFACVRVCVFVCVSFFMPFYIGRSLRRTVFHGKINQANQKRWIWSAGAVYTAHVQFTQLSVCFGKERTHCIYFRGPKITYSIIAICYLNKSIFRGSDKKKRESSNLNVLL